MRYLSPLWSSFSSVTAIAAEIKIWHGLVNMQLNAANFLEFSAGKEQRGMLKVSSIIVRVYMEAVLASLASTNMSCFV